LDGGSKPIRFRKKTKTFYEYASGDDPYSFRGALQSERNRQAGQLIIRLSGDCQEVEGDYVQWTINCPSTTLEHVGVDHGGFDILVTQ
jgi:hypothetical protein